jgi:hypothetical protein
VSAAWLDEVEPAVADHDVVLEVWSETLVELVAVELVADAVVVAAVAASIAIWVPRPRKPATENAAVITRDRAAAWRRRPFPTDDLPCMSHLPSVLRSRRLTEGSEPKLRRDWESAERRAARRGCIVNIWCRSLLCLWRRTMARAEVFELEVHRRADTDGGSPSGTAVGFSSVC